MVWLFPKAVTATTLHIAEASAPASPRGPRLSRGGLVARGGLRGLPVPPEPRAALPAELGSFLQRGRGDTVSRPCGSGLRLRWLRFTYLKPKPVAGARSR